MKIPTSPLLFTLALSSSSLAYPTPKDSPIPNNEISPLLGAGNGGEDAAWGMRPDQMPGKLGRRWSMSSSQLYSETADLDLVVKRQLPTPPSGINSQSVNANAASGLTNTASGLLNPVTGTLGGVTGLLSPATNAAGAASGLLNPVTGAVGGVSGLLNPVSGAVSGAGAAGLLSPVTGVVGSVSGLTGVAGGVTGVLGPASGVVGGVTSGLLGSTGSTGLLGGLGLGGVGGVANNVPLVGSITSPLGITNLQNSPANGGTQGIYANAQNAPSSFSIQDVPTIVANLGGGTFLTSSGSVVNIPRGSSKFTRECGIPSRRPSIAAWRCDIWDWCSSEHFVRRHRLSWRRWRSTRYHWLTWRNHEHRSGSTTTGLTIRPDRKSAGPAQRLRTNHRSSPNSKPRSLHSQPSSQRI